jgi:hypothetical protein
MKQIQPVQIWDKGVLKTAEYLSVVGTYDNYSSEARNRFDLFTKVQDEDDNDVVGELVRSEGLTIDGQDYINWGDQPAMAINEWIYNWVASQINVVIL